ncbi:MAG: hypothetical protein ACR2NP_18450, partial [Pirellulaceae bacterium]
MAAELDQSDQQWQDSAAHRARILELVKSFAGDGEATLCVWGAGPCNDLDLEQLVQSWSHITLVDLDGETLRDAIQVRGLDDSDKVTVIGDYDLSGVAQLVDEYATTKSPDLLRDIQRTGQSFEPDQLGQYDVVVSTCLLSQMFQPLVTLLERSDPQMMILLLSALRRRHLELLVQHTAPGGMALLITDVTSSDALPELALPDADPVELLQSKIVQGNHFHALNPAAIRQAIAQHLVAPQKISEFRVSPPWVWNATHR